MKSMHEKLSTKYYNRNYIYIYIYIYIYKRETTIFRLRPEQGMNKKKIDILRK